MSSELRHPVYVWRDACIAYGGLSIEGTDAEYKAAAIIEADREAVRAEVARAIEVELSMCAIVNVEAPSEWIDGFEFAWKRVKEALGDWKSGAGKLEATKFKALAETLAGALEKLHEAYCADDYGTSEGRAFGRAALIETREALRQYKEARDVAD